MIKKKIKGVNGIVIKKRGFIFIIFKKAFFEIGEFNIPANGCHCDHSDRFAVTFRKI